MYVSHPTTIDYSAIIDNDASNDGGGIYQNNTLTVRNSTIKGNDAVDKGGGIYSSGGSMTLRHVTIRANVFGATNDEDAVTYTSGTYNLRNSLLFGGCSRKSNTAINATSSYATVGSCIGESPLVNSIATSDLGSFVDVSGKSGGYYPLASGSTAIGVGSSTYCLTYDQRNSSAYRRTNSSCDVGAIALATRYPHTRRR